MKKLLLITAVLLISMCLSFGLFIYKTKIMAEKSNKYFKQAEIYYNEYKKSYEKNKELEIKAKEYYLQAAKLGNADAHFALAYKFILPKKESIYHYAEAAKKGNADALDYALEELLFRADSLKAADPQRALALYYQVKKINPNLELYDEEAKLQTLKMCAEPKGFDSDKFMKKYEVKDEDDNFPFYDVWELAEEASVGGRFGKPNPELVLNLVCRGSWVPAELESAVPWAYDNWKKGKIKKFNICSYVTSGAGMGYCASQDEENDKVQRKQKLNKIRNKLGKDSQLLLKESYAAASSFIHQKVISEEAHQGTSASATEISSETYQLNEYLDLTEKIIGGYKPTPKNNFDKADEALNITYKKLLNYLKNKPDYVPTPEGVKSAQIQWVPYRDASAKLFSSINPSTNEEFWKNWLTELREAQLQDILNYKAAVNLN